jgi:hypothetical protein
MTVASRIDLEGLLGVSWDDGVTSSIVARAAAVPSAGLALTSIAALGAAGGGYFPASWGWSAIAFAWVAGLALVVRPALRLGALEFVFVGGLAAFTGWGVASSLWAETAMLPVREAERVVVYVLAALAGLVVTRGRYYRGVLGGTWAAISLVALYALATKLLPDRFGEFNSLEDYRLSEPVGYWNTLGILAVIGALLAVGLAARAPGLPVRALAAASTVVLLPTLYFTFSRGSWIALGAGIAVLVALDSRRLQLLTTLFVLAPAPALAVFLATGTDALIVRGSTFEDATREGHRLAAILVLLAGVAGLVMLALRVVEQRVRIPSRVRLAFGAVLIVSVASLAVGTVMSYGGPVTVVEKGYDSFVSPLPPGSAGNPRERLTTLASPARKDHWRSAWDLYRENSLLGNGAGSYERYWLQHRPTSVVVRDAHSLYLETLAELGPVGLALLVGTLAVPLGAAVRARRRAFIPAAAGAYAAYLVHAGVDWDWEMPVVTVAALLCAVAMLVGGRTEQVRVLPTRVRGGLIAATAALGALAFVGLMGNHALAASRNAEENGELARSESQARRATRWAPWSAEPWQALARVHFERNDLPAARAALLEAVERDRGDWAIWYDLGVASTGRAQQRAYAQAARLNPRSANVEVLRIIGLLPPRSQNGEG